MSGMWCDTMVESKFQETADLEDGVVDVGGEAEGAMGGVGEIEEEVLEPRKASNDGGSEATRIERGLCGCARVREKTRVVPREGWIGVWIGVV